MQDNDLMPFGKHKGEKMANVPDNYLIWFWGENKDKYKKGQLYKQATSIMKYIEDSFEDLP